MTPEEALAAARAEVAALRAVGGYAEPGEGLVVEPLDQVTRAQLLEWALLEPDVTKMRSTRGWPVRRPVTGVKRLLLRGLQQYHNELTSQQTRFNVHVLRKLLELEDRIDALERTSQGEPPAPETAGGGHEDAERAGSGTPGAG